VQSGRPAEQLPAIIRTFGDFLAAFSKNASLRNVAGTFSLAVARWLKGYERLDTFVSILSAVGLAEQDFDRLFPTFRVHPYYDTGERFTGADGKPHPVLSSQPSFGIYAYHEGSLEGWETSIQGAQRIDENLYLLSVPNKGTAKVTTRIQAVGKGEARIPEDPIKPAGGPPSPPGCLDMILGLFGLNKK
jgi:hypothetical protein